MVFRDFLKSERTEIVAEEKGKLSNCGIRCRKEQEEENDSLNCSLFIYSPLCINHLGVPCTGGNITTD